ncbi:MAG: type II toxin-antitoxin system RelB/DinJ family antitoxin [Mobiluncus porci]|uniref:Type II toxin-antitoxin system RelB/DinJ family antitoxin n=1 Tax=Mobiluncus porci TaxID=2652278 RepID=A0A7K0JZV1_9ACTO|nr:type II toxin-antitoxin system RelB/DinJ family antitoxin [Mobiluncus porci]MDD7542232.1 type II toxin-antitoxin system RelB/DinJ family antitoxin [Mobiluncus porci]MDY5749031.1 type II toxin-antitoxin system RelB/DinJ family antitoxin [Mobiluncus porci]MST48658.1 type II toxin-antitoxin system RelB/DinJ family antitoxin [Mobiluncus porci]
MSGTTITIRTDSELKNDATKLFEGLGMNLSVAINMFLRQAVSKQKYPLSLDLEIGEGAKSSYPKGFFELFGAGADLGFDEEPEDLPLDGEDMRL